MNMRIVIHVAAMLAILCGAATVSGCLSTYRTDARGQRYHVGDEWVAFRFDKNYNLHLVK